MDERYQRQQEVPRERLSRLRTCGVKDCGAEAATSGGLRYYGVAAAAHADAHPHSRRVLVRLVLVLGSLRVALSVVGCPSCAITTHPPALLHIHCVIRRSRIRAIRAARATAKCDAKPAKLGCEVRHEERPLLTISHPDQSKQQEVFLAESTFIYLISRIIRSTILLLIRNGVSIIIHF